jgi:DNA-directed RNA polymerase specialized sigma24 family protein
VPPLTLDTDELAPLIAEGDDEAFARWMSLVEGRIRDRLRSFAARVDVESVMQETLLGIWQIAPRFVPDGRENGLMRLAIRIAGNLAVTQYRRRRPLPMDMEALEAAAAAGDDTSPGPDRASDPLLRRRILDCLGRLPRQPGRAIRARLEDGGVEPDATLAGWVGMQPNTFLQNITRARKLLAECLRRVGIDLQAELA